MVRPPRVVGHATTPAGSALLQALPWQPGTCCCRVADQPRPYLVIPKSRDAPVPARLFPPRHIPLSRHPEEPSMVAGQIISSILGWIMAGAGYLALSRWVRGDGPAPGRRRYLTW